MSLPSAEGYAIGEEARQRQVQALRDAFAAQDKSLQARRRKFHQDTAEANIQILDQSRIRKTLARLSKTYWGRTSAERKGVRAEYSRVLRTTKILADDVFIETLQAILDRPVAPERAEETTKARKTYWDTLVTFVRASPFLFTEPTERKKDLFRLPSTPAHLKLLVPSVPSVSDSFGAAVPEYLLDLAADRADSSFRAAVDDSKVTALDEEAVHLQGLTFLLQQMFLVRLRSIGAPGFPGSAWYRIAGAELSRMRQAVLGRLAEIERAAVIERNDSVRSVALYELGNQLLDELARVYSVRAAVTTELWAFRRGLVDDERFAESRLLVGANDITERLTSYIGRANPDHDRGIDVISVDHLVEHAGTLEGEAVRVVGQLAARASALNSLTTRVKVKLRIDGELLAAGRADDVAVQVNGVLELVKSVPLLAVEALEPFAEEYASHVGLPMPRLFSGELDLRASWRTLTNALKAEADEHIPADSVSAAVMGQEQLITALAYFPPVRKVLLARIEQNKPFDLHDSAFRADLWSALFDFFHDHAADRALQNLLDYLQRYLTHFTRHTLWNVRDSGRDYFRTTWPQSIAGRELYDCGVYAVLTAYDIYRAVSGNKTAKRVDFGFVTFLNHITLVGYVDGKSFFVNNDKIHGLRDIPGGAGLAKADLARFAVHTWGPLGFNEVYELPYGIAIVRVPHWTISTRLSEDVFKKRLWANYKRFAKWWGLKTVTAYAHHREMAEYNTTMIKLGRMLKTLDDPTVPREEKAGLNKAITLVADDLFNRANALANKVRYFENGRVADEGSVAVLHRESSPPPLYDVVRRLVAARAAGETLTAEEVKVVNRPATPAEHSDALNIEANLI